MRIGLFAGCMMSSAAKESFQVGGYLENWKAYKGMEPFNTVYYAFLTLDQHPNPESPRDGVWDGKAIYESMAAASVIEVMTKTDPAWKNPNEWQRVKIQKLIDDCKARGQTFMWSIGGWSDLQRTIQDEQIPALVDQVVGLLQLGGDGADFDWEHLSTSSDAALRQQQRAVLGKFFKVLRKALDAKGMKEKHISYTTRWNCFWTSNDAVKYGALSFASDGECLDTFSHASSDDVSWVNLMMYDASPGTAFKDKNYFTVDTYKAVLTLGAQTVDKSKIVMGFEPGNQAAKGIWEGFDIDFEVVDYMKSNGYGGVMFWALNEESTAKNPGTPSSKAHPWQGSTGANSQYIAKNIISLSSSDVYM